MYRGELFHLLRFAALRIGAEKLWHCCGCGSPRFFDRLPLRPAGKGGCAAFRVYHVGYPQGQAIELNIALLQGSSLSNWIGFRAPLNILRGRSCGSCFRHTSQKSSEIHQGFSAAFVSPDEKSLAARLTPNNLRYPLGICRFLVFLYFLS